MVDDFPEIARQECFAVSVQFQDREETLFLEEAVFQTGDIVTVREESVLDIGRVAWVARADARPQQQRNLTVTKASAEEKNRFEDYLRRAARALVMVRNRIAEADMPMKAAKVVYSFSTDVATVYYTAPERIDFRSLVLTLAKDLRAKIQMKQISAHEEARLLGGIGSYGPHGWWPEERNK